MAKMYRPSKYGKHYESMEAFAQLFNDCPVCPNLKMLPIQDETFLDDGDIIDESSGKKFGFGWEYRDRYFSNGKFRFDTLGQYERKIIKPSIQLSIQCDSTETAVAVAWHEDFKRENQITLLLDTDYIDKQLGQTRYTKSFRIYMYEDIADFKRMIQRALDGKLDCSAFEE